MPKNRRPIMQSRTGAIDGFRNSSRATRNPVLTNKKENSVPLYDPFIKTQPKSSLHTSSSGTNMFGIHSVGPLGLFRKNILRIHTALPVLVLLLILTGSLISLVNWRSANSVEAEHSIVRSSVESGNDTSSEISERRPTNIEDYQVSSDLPRFLRINGMGLTARVRRVGVGVDTELRLPSNIYDAGWYENSVKPGENGAVVLTGHAFGPSKPGIFHDLKELKPGDTIDLETGDGERYQYYVAKLEAFDADDSLGPMLVSALPGTPGLNLITELGHFDEISNTYDQRLVVYTVLDNYVQTP